MDTGVRRNSPNRDSSSKKPSNTPLPIHYGPVGTGKTHLAVALGRLACMRAIPVGFFTMTGLLMRLRRAKREDRLDAELRQIARARLPVIDEFGYMPIDRTVRHGRLTGFEGGSYRSEHALMTR